MIDIEHDEHDERDGDVENEDEPRRWRWISGLAVVAVLAAGIALAVSRPWSDDSAAPSTTEPAAQLTNQLIVDQPPGDLTLTAALPAGPRQAEPSDDVIVLADPTTVGVVFASEGATFQRGRFMALYASPLDEADQFADDEGDEINVRGMPGRLAMGGDDVSIAYWGPDDNDYRYSIAANGFDAAAMLAAAEAFRVDDGVAVIDGGVVGDLQPVGEVRTLFLAFQLVSAVDIGETSPEVTTVVYGDPFAGGLQLSSVPSPEEDPLRMFSFLFGSTTPATIHDQPAIVAENSADLMEGSAVAWVEGGQLIVLSGQLPVPELISAAQSVRPASAEEWAVVEKVGAIPGLGNEGG